MLRDYVSPEAIMAAGNACRGLGEAIKGLAAADMHVEAEALTKQLLQLSKSIGWMTREDRSKYDAG